MGFNDINHSLLIWRLHITPCLKSGNSVLELVHREQLPPSLFTLVCPLVYVSKKYIVSVLSRQSSDDIDKEEITIEVRSTADFSVVFSTVNERVARYFCFSFAKDIFAVQIIGRNLKNIIRYSLINFITNSLCNKYTTQQIGRLRSTFV